MSALQDTAAFKHDPSAWLAAVGKEPNITTRRAQLEGVVAAIENSLSRSVVMCVRAARLAFNAHYNIAIRQLLHNFPTDYVDASGVKFWSGPKRAPEPLDFDPSDPVHLAFITSFASVLANSYNVALPPGARSLPHTFACRMVVQVRAFL